MRPARLFYGAGLLVGLLLAGAPAGAQDATSGPAAEATGGLDLSIRARALGIVPDTVTGGAGTLGLEPMRAPTGAGTTRMPRAVSGAERGLYVGAVVCDPDGVDRLYMVPVDDAGSLPEGNLRGTPGPRGLYLPGRPLP